MDTEDASMTDFSSAIATCQSHIKNIESKVNGVTFDALQEKIIKVELDNKPLTLQDMISKKRR